MFDIFCRLSCVPIFRSISSCDQTNSLHFFNFRQLCYLLFIDIKCTIASPYLLYKSKRVKITSSQWHSICRHMSYIWCSHIWWSLEYEIFMVLHLLLLPLQSSSSSLTLYISSILFLSNYTDKYIRKHRHTAKLLCMLTKICEKTTKTEHIHWIRNKRSRE